MQVLTQYLIIGLGGALGSMLRFGVAMVIDTTVTNPDATKAGSFFPWGVILVNITGCFVIGFVNGITAPDARYFLSPLARQFIMIGILGGYTTFSSFSLQTLQLAQEGEWFGAAANVIISVVLCLAGVWLGTALAGMLNQMR